MALATPIIWALPWRLPQRTQSGIISWTRAGASGIIAALKANENNDVILLELNDKCGKKLLVTGNGRCNYWNSDISLEQYETDDKDILKEVLSEENKNNTLSFLDSLGIYPKIKNGYYYPYSNQALTIKNMLEEKAISLGVEIRYNSLVTDVCKEDDKFVILCNDERITCDELVIATGSRAYPKTGSDGKGYQFLRNFDIDMVEVVPALVQLTSDFKYLKDWDGVRSDVRLELFEDGKFIDTEDIYEGLRLHLLVWSLSFFE